MCRKLQGAPGVVPASLGFMGLKIAGKQNQIKPDMGPHASFLNVTIDMAGFTFVFLLVVF